MHDQVTSMEYLFMIKTSTPTLVYTHQGMLIMILEGFERHSYYLIMLVGDVPAEFL